MFILKSVIILLLAFCKLFALVTDSTDTPEEVVFPIRHHKTRLKNDLKTLNGDSHENSATYEINTKNGGFVFDITKDAKVYQRSIWVGNYVSSKTLKHNKLLISKHIPDDCYYHGKIRDVEDSYVFISTCSGGLIGTIDNGKTIHDILPTFDGNKHRLINADAVIQRSFDILQNLSYIEHGRDQRKNFRFQRSFFLSNQTILLNNVDSQYVPYMTHKVPRYIEAFVSCDHRMLPRYNNDSNLLIERVLNSFAQVDKAYQEINIRLIVVAIDIQKDQSSFQRFEKGGMDLSSFKNYVNKFVKKSSGFKDVSFDVGIFLSHKSWSDSLGMAYVNSMCEDSAASVVTWNYDSISGPTYVLGHELGHNMGFYHDNISCTCLTNKGCFMGASKSIKPGFSDCNIKVIQRNTYPCLTDYSYTSIKKVCGNGILEDDEECDCGTFEMCLRNGDNCCEPHGCVLKAHAQCSYINNPECCSTECIYRKHGTLCREADGPCDLPEYCSGDNPNCPKDVTKRNGFPCSNGIKKFSGPVGNSNSISKLSPQISLRYLKIIPNQWIDSDYAGFKLDVRGCPDAKDYIFRPTSITSAAFYYHDPFCISPQITSCSELVPDGTVLKYINRDTHSGHCEHDYMKFLFAADGSLTHNCSGKFVCINSEDHLILNATCTVEVPKFRRTKERSLQNIQSQKCVRCVANGDGWPSHKCTVGLESKCIANYSQKVIIMNILECDVPLGLSNKALPESSYSAGSFYSKVYNPSNVIPDGNGWRPLNKGEPSWLQIDFGKIVRVGTIEMIKVSWVKMIDYTIKYSQNNIVWLDYMETDPAMKMYTESLCFSGNCVPSLINQCRNLWQPDATVASDSCWNNMNTNLEGFGTCSPISNTSCSQSNIKCGQLQCDAKHNVPVRVPDYGKSYQKFVYDEQQCSGASITESEQIGLGMVSDGSICAENKFCYKQECKSLNELGFKSCSVVGSKECSDNGFCSSEGKCLCKSGYNPDNGCQTKLNPIDGAWSSWSEYTKCSKGCGGGVKQRYRFCNNPIAKYGGKDCVGIVKEDLVCNLKPCPVAESCKVIKSILEKNDQPLYDGVYTITPSENFTLNVYCDMTRDGGGWTLIVSSHSNTWNTTNVWLRNIIQPGLYNDYSILKYANKLKSSYKIIDSVFNYRLEANERGRWGGIFSAPSRYNISSTNFAQISVSLVQRFDDWNFSSHSIQQRLPYVSGHKLTTSDNSLTDQKDSWGSITDNQSSIHTSKWIQGSMKMSFPEHIWYWVREGDYSHPSSCLELFFRSLAGLMKYSSGVYEIEIAPGYIVKTYCDLNRHGGGWSLLANVVSKNWTLEKSKFYSSENLLDEDFSIIKYLEKIKIKDNGENSYQIMLEANSSNDNGGIFALPVKYNSTLCSTHFKPTILKKFGKWNVDVENISKYPICTSDHNGIFLSANSMKGADEFGVIIGQGKYMTSIETPSFIRLWIREGGSRHSCNDLRVHGLHKGQMHKDGFYMLADNQPVYCDMTTTENEGWTLIVSSASSGWTLNEIYSRNSESPSLFDNFSILNKANTIKHLSNKKTFKYMIDAQERRRWGGIWESQKEYSLTSSISQKTKFLKQFDTWDNHTWWKGPQSFLPWITKGQKGLLVTSRQDVGGSIISNDSLYYPSEWIHNEKINPGVIWYWLNENDCNSNYKPVDGQLSPWSSWSTCSSFCGGGKEERKRYCIPPSCGGLPCSLSTIDYEERACTGKCIVTKIQLPGDLYCIEPDSGGCKPADNTVLVLRPKSTYCKSNLSDFVFNPATGSLFHNCSGKPVCSRDGYKRGHKMVLSSLCPKPELRVKLQRTLWHSIQVLDVCLDPLGSTLGNNVNLGLWGSCHEAKRKFLMPGLGDGPVVVTLFQDVVSLPAFKSDLRYPNHPTTKGRIDNLDLPTYTFSKSGIRMFTYFKASQSGFHTFVISCDDVCELLFATDASNRSSVTKIAGTSAFTERFQWNKYIEQESPIVNLTADTKYYMEINLVNIGGLGHAAVGVKMPSGEILAPITYDYLYLNSE
ncbi:uncharacterized protein LOC101234350 [Hydra vulgaris]|uniref:uncharacterized protein LOC101234350 n=1 Tax=Hydra vulgaris TaxID=6087 RepID=UPI001F5E7403|nr:uncharacterized protein LOC101234350 [Hydra vulgaris]XP_047127013.1 uncharacterized protein LOC101234350 [Hydra vulgaris]